MNKKLFMLKLSASFAVISILLSSAATANSASGTLTMNLDANALASFNGGANSVGSRYLYVESYNNATATSSTGLAFTVNGSSNTSIPFDSFFQTTNLNYGSDPTTGTGQIGLSGVVAVQSDFFSGYLQFSDLSLSYSTSDGQWEIATHEAGFGTDKLFDLYNVVTSTNSAGLLSLTGNLVFDPQWASFLNVDSTTTVGSVSLAPAAVPVPASIGLFGSGIASLFVGIRRNTKAIG